MTADHPHIHVACAIIESAGRVLAARRSASMRLPLKWEFPGGKLHAGESPEECLVREVQEELGVVVAINRPLRHSIHIYPDFRITLYPFICRIAAGEIVLYEHAEIAWLPPEKLAGLDWAEADLPVIAEYLRFSGGKCTISA